MNNKLTVKYTDEHKSSLQRKWTRKRQPSGLDRKTHAALDADWKARLHVFSLDRKTARLQPGQQDGTSLAWKARRHVFSLESKAARLQPGQQDGMSSAFQTHSTPKQLSSKTLPEAVPFVGNLIHLSSGGFKQNIHDGYFVNR